MQPRVPARTENRLFAYIATLLIAYGGVGVAVHLRLLPLIFTGLGSWLSLPAASSSTAAWGVLSPLQAHFDALPWLPWLAWLAGTGLLAWGRRATPPSTAIDARQAAPPPAYYRWLPIVLLALLLVLAAYMRMVELWPQSYGLSQFPYDDEGVYAGASQLFVQGILPYRDYFFAHPPVAALSYAPAMLYHFTQWGSPTSFMDARYLSVFYSLVTLVLVFFIAYRLAGVWGGATAGLLWALDGRIVEINRKVMLDGPMVLLSCAGLLIYLWVRPVLAGEPASRLPRRPQLILGLAACVAALSALTKVAGVACLVAIVVDLLWLHFDNRRRKTTLAPLLPQIWSVIVGVLLAAVVVLGPFLLIAPSQIIRDIFFFQILRPSDGLIDIPARIADISSTLFNALTPLCAALGFIAVSFAVWRRPSEDAAGQSGPTSAWRTVALWSFFSLLLFTYSRSFYSHYYIQLAAPLCLLGSGITLVPGLVKSALAGIRLSVSPTWVRAVPALLLLVVAVPLAAVEWNGNRDRHEDRIFEIVGRYVSDAVKPGTPVLTTDEQFNFLAARPPSHSSTGYLIDSYGHMIFLGLGLDKRDWGDLIQSSLKGIHSNDAYAVMHSPAAQQDILNRAVNVPLIVIHQKGEVRMTQDTLAAIRAMSTVAEQQTRYTIYRVTTPGLSQVSAR